MNEETRERLARETWEGAEGDEYYFSLMHPKGVAKKRTCIRCKELFNSRSSGHRFCTRCASVGKKNNNDFFSRRGYEYLG